MRNRPQTAIRCNTVQRVPCITTFADLHSMLLRSCFGVPSGDTNLLTHVCYINNKMSLFRPKIFQSTDCRCLVQFLFPSYSISILFLETGLFRLFIAQYHYTLKFYCDRHFLQFDVCNLKKLQNILCREFTHVKSKK
jgi:hypothetical protein